jgi:hypothetical protein
MKIKPWLILIIYTLLLLYAGLWSELTSRVKFNDWDIIGANGRVTNHNLYSNLYLFGLLFIIVYNIYYYLKHI